MKYIYELSDDDSTWIHELKEINDRLLFIGQCFANKREEYQEAFFRAQAAVCDCISTVLDLVPYEKKPSNIVEEAQMKREEKDGQ